PIEGFECLAELVSPSMGYAQRKTALTCVIQRVAEPAERFCYHRSAQITDQQDDEHHLAGQRGEQPLRCHYGLIECGAPQNDVHCSEPDPRIVDRSYETQSGSRTHVCRVGHSLLCGNPLLVIRRGVCLADQSVSV